MIICKSVQLRSSSVLLPSVLLIALEISSFSCKGIPFSTFYSIATDRLFGLCSLAGRSHRPRSDFRCFLHIIAAKFPNVIKQQRFQKVIGPKFLLCSEVAHFVTLFIAPSLSFQGDQAVDAHAARAPPPPYSGGGVWSIIPYVSRGEDRALLGLLWGSRSPFGQED